MVFADDRDEEYYFMNLTEFNTEKKLLKKFIMKDKRWQKNKECAEKLKNDLNKSHRTFSNNVKVETVEKPGPRILKIKRHNHKDVWKVDKELEVLKKEAAKKAIEKEENRKVVEVDEKVEEKEKSKEDKKNSIPKDLGSKSKSAKRKAKKAKANDLGSESTKKENDEKEVKMSCASGKCVKSEEKRSNRKVEVLTRTDGEHQVGIASYQTDK